MPVGVYTGTVTLSPSSGGTVTIPVTLNLTSGIALSASVSSVQFYYQVGSVPPGSQMFSISTGNAPLNFGIVTSTTNGISWLLATPSSGTTPNTITVSVVPGQLSVGTYSGDININVAGAANPTLDIRVTLTISSGALLTAQSFPAPFVYQLGSQAPASQTVTIGSTTGSLNYTVTTATSNGGNWLAVSPLNGTTPANLTIGVIPTGLAAGTYTGTVTVSGSGAREHNRDPHQPEREQFRRSAGERAIGDPELPDWRVKRTAEPVPVCHF